MPANGLVKHTRLVKLAVGLIMGAVGLYVFLNAVLTPLYLASVQGGIVAFAGLLLMFLALVVVLTRTGAPKSIEAVPPDSEMPQVPIQPITNATLEARRDYTMATMGMAPTFIDPRMRDEPINKRRD
jgi:sulfite exporter TauE/SafE